MKSKLTYKEALAMAKLLKKHGFVMDYIPSKMEFDSPRVKAKLTPKHPMCAYKGSLVWVNPQKIDPDDGTIY